MKNSAEATRLRTAIQESPVGSTVYVSKTYAEYYVTPPRDGRSYIVQDRARKKIWHWTFPDGTYECHDAMGQIGPAPISIVTVRKKKVKPADGWKPSKQRLARQLTKGKVIKGQSDAPPEICLIDIERVMRITGYRKSFIYDCKGFPQPVKLGDTQRSSVRWLESEIYSWCESLISKRNTNTASK